MSVILLILGIWFVSSVVFGLLAGRFFQVARNMRHEGGRRYLVARRAWHVKPQAS